MTMSYNIITQMRLRNKIFSHSWCLTQDGFAFALKILFCCFASNISIHFCVYFSLNRKAATIENTETIILFVILVDKILVKLWPRFNGQSALNCDKKENLIVCFVYITGLQWTTKKVETSKFNSSAYTRILYGSFV